METPVRDRLKKKSKKKNNVPESTENPFGENMDIFAMMNQVSSLLKQNPDIVNKVNQMVSGVMTNKDLIESLASQFQDINKTWSGPRQWSGPDNGQDQTLASSSETESLPAVSKDSKQ